MMAPVAWAGWVIEVDPEAKHISNHVFQVPPFRRLNLDFNFFILEFRETPFTYCELTLKIIMSGIRKR